MTCIPLPFRQKGGNSNRSEEVTSRREGQMEDRRTPIDFGKDFLRTLYTKRDAQEVEQYLAADLVWITPEQTRHFLSREESLAFVQEQIGDDPRRRYVDVQQIRSAPSSEQVRTIAYEVKLVPEKAEQTLSLRCSMAVLCAPEAPMQISALHFSEATSLARARELEQMIDTLPCAILLLSQDPGGELRCRFPGRAMADLLGYSAASFGRRSLKDPLFMLGKEDRAAILAQMRSGRGEWTLQVSAAARSGKRLVLRLAGRLLPAEKTWYCAALPVTELVQERERLQGELLSAGEILGSIPGVPVLLQRQADGRWQVLQAGAGLSGLFGISTSAYRTGVVQNPLFSLVVTEQTRQRITDGWIENTDPDPYCGRMQLRRPDRSTVWVDLYITHGRDATGEETLLLYYLPCDRQQRRLIHEQEQAQRARTVRARAARDTLERSKRELQRQFEQEKQQLSAQYEERLRREAAQSQAQIRALQEEISALREKSDTHERNERSLRRLLLQGADDGAAGRTRKEPGEKKKERPALHSAPFSVAESVDFVCSCIRPRAAVRDVRIQTRCEADPPEQLMGDALCLQKVLSAFLERALVVTPEHGTVLLRWRADKPRLGRCVLHFFVLDGGGALSDEQIRALFAPEGVLAGAAERIERMGGSLRVGRREKGIEAAITLPLALVRR